MTEAFHEALQLLLDQEDEASILGYLIVGIDKIYGDLKKLECADEHFKRRLHVLIDKLITYRDIIKEEEDFLYAPTEEDNEEAEE